MKWLAAIIAWITGLFSQNIIDPLAGYVVRPASVTPAITESVPAPTGEPVFTVIPSRKPTVRPKPTAVGDTSPWGVARQIDENTWTMKVGMDERMATPKEILDALNDYRVRRGSQRLTWDEKLATYAQSRADYLYSIKNVDGHKGFGEFLENQNGYDKLGFTWLGENISYGYRLEGVHLVEWMYAGDKPHDDNQVNNRWNYVGIGVKGTATALIFGTGKR